MAVVVVVAPVIEGSSYLVQVGEPELREALWSEALARLEQYLRREVAAVSNVTDVLIVP